jgi:peptidylprolyl isomerase
MSPIKKFFFTLSSTVTLSSLLFIVYFFISSPKVMASKEVVSKLEDTLYIYVPAGKVVVEMLPAVAPKHVEQIKRLARKGFYNGLAFHRVIEGFMAQGGDPKGDGTGGSGKNIPAEFSKLAHKRGAVSMARASNPDSADSQFFIVTKDSNFLDGQYTVWGYVISGMDFVDQLKKGSGGNGMVSNPDKIIKMVVAIDEETENAKNSKK